MIFNNAIYGETLGYGEVIYSSYESTFAPSIAKFERYYGNRFNTFKSISILRGHAIVNYHWKITSERGEWVNESGPALDSITYTWPRSGGKFTVSLTITDSVGNTSTYTQTYLIEQIVEDQQTANSSYNLPVYEQHGFELIRRKKAVKISLLSIDCDDIEMDIKCISVDDIEEKKPYIYVSMIVSEE